METAGALWRGEEETGVLLGCVESFAKLYKKTVLVELDVSLGTDEYLLMNFKQILLIPQAYG